MASKWRFWFPPRCSCVNISRPSLHDLRPSNSRRSAFEVPDGEGIEAGPRRYLRWDCRRVIATHRLLSPQTRFKDLGLVIVDEEQRFGVEHKEHLKALRANVDVLTMSATPIPRTLEMAVTGIREMSTIATPPEQRLPVLTYVGPFDNSQITAAIRRELLREGQVFFIHNRVESIDRAARKINELVPEAGCPLLMVRWANMHLSK